MSSTPRCRCRRARPPARRRWAWMSERIARRMGSRAAAHARCHGGVSRPRHNPESTCPASRAHPLHYGRGVTSHHSRRRGGVFRSRRSSDTCGMRLGRLRVRVSGSVARLLRPARRSQAARRSSCSVGRGAASPGVRRIASAGHEIASHGWDHARVTEQSPLAFRDSISPGQVSSGSHRRSRRRLWAPSFSIVRPRMGPGRADRRGYRYDRPVSVAAPAWLRKGDAIRRLRRPTGRLAEVPAATLRAGAPSARRRRCVLPVLPYGVLRCGAARLRASRGAGTSHHRGS